MEKEADTMNEKIQKISSYIIRKKESKDKGTDVRKNVARRLKYLKKILPLDLQNCDISDFKTDDVRLCILAELVYDYFSEPIAGETDRKGREIFNDVADYYNAPTKTIKQHNHIEYTDEELNALIMFFIDNYLWETSELYHSETERIETLQYLNTFYQTFYFWNYAKSSKTKFKYDSDIYNFLMALYDEEQLPDMEYYIEEEFMPEELVENVKSSYIYDV